MNIAKETKEIIRTLEANRFYAECPCCGEAILLKDAGLFYLDGFSPDAKNLHRQMIRQSKEREEELRERRKEIPRSSEIGAEAVNIGFILERLVPSMKYFLFDRNDCRAVFDPIDYVVFEGLNKKGSVSKILFVEIKTGNGRLNQKQREIRSLVEHKRVFWDTY